MRLVRFIPLVLVLAAGCSEPSIPTEALELTPSYAKKGGGGGGGGTAGCTTCPVDDTYTFELGSVVGATTSFDTDAQAGSVAIASPPAIVDAPTGESFIGRFNNTKTQLLLSVPAGHPKYSLTFHLYTIGSWDGKGKQAQQGTFLANVVTLGYRCSGSPDVAFFSSTFSNQLTVQQDFPANTALGQAGGNKAATGSLVQEALNYRAWPDSSNTPSFRSFGDVTYSMSFAGDNPCNTGAITFVWSTTAPNQQSNHDESWGIDNVTIKAGT